MSKDSYVVIIHASELKNYNITNYNPTKNYSLKFNFVTVVYKKHIIKGTQVHN